MSTEVVRVPDIGSASCVDVIDINVQVGDIIEVDQSIIVLETDKASMDIPSPIAGKVISISVSEGSQVSEDSEILVVEVKKSGEESGTYPVLPEEDSKVGLEEAQSHIIDEREITVPDIGDDTEVDVIDVCVKEGYLVEEGDSLITLEGDKASMDIPSPYSGKVGKIFVKIGDSVSKGSGILLLEIEPATPTLVSHTLPSVEERKSPISIAHPNKASISESSIPSTISTTKVHAGPAVRMLARELGVDLSCVNATGPHGRIRKEDIHTYVKTVVQHSNIATDDSVIGSTILPTVPDQDFSKFGTVEVIKMTKIQKITAQNMVRNTLVAPQVTQFDKIDITDLESFRKNLKSEMEKQVVKLTILPFLIKAIAQTLVANPRFNVSLMADNESYVQKHYVHIGIAVDSPLGLVVPVLLDADKKSVIEIAKEVGTLINKALDKQLNPSDMQGGCFTISSLGAIGGTGFTPIVNCPEVGILGVSKVGIEPCWDGQKFEPRSMLPLCLSYDHRAINGRDAASFMMFLNSLLSDIRRLSL